jgi:hypothetical protein
MIITVVFKVSELKAFGADIHAGIHILEGLEKAGIPVVGQLLPLGVSTGELTMRMDTDHVLYAWDGEEDLA